MSPGVWQIKFRLNFEVPGISFQPPSGMTPLACISMTIPSPLGSLGIIFQYLKHISVPSDHLYKFISIGLADWQQTVHAAQASQWAQPAKYLKSIMSGWKSKKKIINYQFYISCRLQLCMSCYYEMLLLENTSSPNSRAIPWWFFPLNVSYKIRQKFCSFSIMYRNKVSTVCNIHDKPKSAQNMV